jgi:hypothetical protein
MDAETWKEITYLVCEYRSAGDTYFLELVAALVERFNDPEGD